MLCKNARFQFLTPSLVRMEFSPNRAFVDAPTVLVLKRDWKQTGVTVETRKDWVVAKTSRLTLRYLPGSGEFTQENLRISWTDGSQEISWTPGDSDRNNLGGILYSLDGLRRNRLAKAAPGILSRSGYFILDDSETPVWDNTTSWIAPRKEKENQDWYLFVYGRDYKHVLREYTELCGKIPMIPQYTLGTWMTDLNYEYLPGTEFVEKFHYTDKDVMNLVDRFKSEGLPLDVLVLDFAWHRFGWKGGYDWSPVFPEPDTFLAWTRARGLKVTLNDHPGYGRESVLSDEDSRAQTVRAALGIRPPPKPTFLLDLAAEWKFQIDPDTTGVRSNWFATQFNDATWPAVEAGRIWEDQGYAEYDGMAWYRKWISIPGEGTVSPLYLIFGGVDDEYDLYINGKLVAHRGAPNSSVYNSITFTDISKAVQTGEKNLVVLRVNDWGGGGGISAAPALLSDQPPAEGIRFNLADMKQAKVFMNVLHKPLIDQGAAFWWVDGGRGSSEMEGLNSQLWTNRIFYDFTEEHTKQRGFIFSRYGGWGSHRYPAFFTGDTYSHWEVLAYEVPFTAQGGNVLMPYITHDIGGFIGPNVSFDLYARWLEFGAFSPFVRLHSAHENPRDGNVRMPWTYGEKGIELARKFLRLRYNLIPYIYTYCRAATDEGLPLVRPLYLEYPSIEEAYSYPHEYFFGKEFLVAPIVDSTGQKEIYLPPGEWIEYFTGKRHKGNQVFHATYAVDQIPVFVKSGSIIPLRADVEYTSQRPLDTLVIDVYGPESAEFMLYEDDGISLEYRSGNHARTPLAFSQRTKGNRLTIGPTTGKFKGQLSSRTHQLRFHGLRRPSSVTVNGQRLQSGTQDGWRWDGRNSVLSVSVGSRTIREAIHIDIL